MTAKGAPLLDEPPPAKDLEVTRQHVTGTQVPGAGPVEPSPSTAIAGFITVIERLAANPQVDVTKLEKIIELQERILDRNAKAAFEAAYAQMQPDIPEIDEKGQILVKGTLRSSYAKLEDIHKAIKPVLKAHGFALRHRTEWPDDRKNIIRIVGILSHVEGHSEESAFEAPMDQSEYRTDIQSMGSTVSYGRRYTTIDLLNIATRSQDNDGSTAGRPQPPHGYPEYWFELMAAADLGITALEAAWHGGKPEYKTYTVTHNKAAWEGLKKKAAGLEAS